MGLKGYAKKHLGETWLWRGLRKMKRHAKTLVVAIIPKRLLYRLLQTSLFYGETYFDSPKNALLQSGYGDGYNDATEFQEVARLSRDLFNPGKVLDVGCAKGFQVSALRSHSMEAWGIDISEYAIRSAPPEVSPWLQVGSCTEIAFPDASFDLLLVLETLEHLPPSDVDKTVAELRRVTARWLWASIPSIGVNRYGQDGYIEGKIKERYLDLYGNKTIDRVPFSHLLVDVDHIPLHGHLTIASFDWWTSLFGRHGFIRRGDKELELNERLEPARIGLWNSMVFEKITNPEGNRPVGFSRSMDLREMGPGVWETSPFSLPSGLHVARLTFEVPGSERGGEKLGRAIHAEALSRDTLRINGSCVVSAAEMRRMASKGRIASIPLTLCNRDDEEMVLRLVLNGNMGIKPLPAVEISCLQDI